MERKNKNPVPKGNLGGSVIIDFISSLKKLVDCCVTSTCFSLPAPLLFYGGTSLQVCSEFDEGYTFQLPIHYTAANFCKELLLNYLFYQL